MKNKRITIVLAVVYALLAVWIILFKTSPLSEIANLDRMRSINLIPFHYDVERVYHRSEVINNIVIFLPIGVYLKMLKLKNTNAVICGAAFSFILEVLQFVIGIGATDITDLITNTLGAVIGVGLYCVLSFVFRKNEKLDKVLVILASVCTVFLIAFVSLLLLLN